MPRKQSKFGQPGVYNATLPTFNDGEPGAVAIDQNGRQLVSTGVAAATSTNQGVGVNGGDTSTQFESAVSVQTTDTALIAARAGRKFLTITNDSANTVYITTKATAAAGTGFRLNANGGVLLLDRYVPQGALRAIALTGASNVTVVEGI